MERNLVKFLDQSNPKSWISDKQLSPQSLFEGTLGRVNPADEKVRQLVVPILEKGGYYFVAVEEDQLAGWVLVGSNQDPFTERNITMSLKLE
ncbi:hypothetical protein B7C51_14860 [Paenibacillus larvae subsp. pulvifaciens]|uniref:Uncharacterized protein n=1 Tax=Paenibacillus larvae subsp. pulvifaciens TaxID=1477 RepID=A0A1V0UUI2_9BACL|nr:hypothetical protein [Paenibacillus larvae]ARF68796.1 hypothetical protein B7C51_14860 [Paenibacillus larvae subsp. pulvifaciens]